MPTQNVYLNDETYAKGAYIAEARNVKLGKLFAQWLAERIQEEVKKEKQ